jgi:hypothetical protein
MSSGWYAHLHAFQAFLDKETSIYEQLHIQQLALTEVKIIHNKNTL